MIVFPVLKIHMPLILSVNFFLTCKNTSRKTPLDTNRTMRKPSQITLFKNTHINIELF